MSTQASETVAGASHLLPERFIEQLKQGEDARVVLGRVDPSLFEPAALPAVSRDRYTRFEVHADAEVLVVLIVWLPGQFSVPHDHGGSACDFRVVRGVATEQRFEVQDDGLVAVVEEDRFLAGSIVSCQGDDIHALGNDADSSEPLVTLHVYRPRPMMREYVPVKGGAA